MKQRVKSPWFSDLVNAQEGARDDVAEDEFQTLAESAKQSRYH